MPEEEQVIGRNPVALVGGTLIDGRGGAPQEDSVVLVSGRIIEAAGSIDAVQVPADAEVVDVSGKTIMPGMIDCHCHISLTSLSLEENLFTPPAVRTLQAAEMMRRTLQAGFTTIRDAGTLNDTGFRQAVEMGLIEGPRLVLAGALVQTGGHFDLYYPCGVRLPFLGGEVCDGVTEVQKAARKVLREGFDFIKVSTSGGVGFPGDSPWYTEWTLEELRSIVYEASARGKAVMAHAMDTQSIKNAVLAGVWSIEHGSSLDDEAIQLLLDTGTYLVSTHMIIQRLSEPGGGMHLAPLCRADAERLLTVHFESFKRAVTAGVKIAVGTDAITAEMHGQNARELENVVRYGLTPMQAIVAATKTASEVCRMDDKVGTLQPGKLADLLVVNGNPLNDISILQDKSRLLLIMKEGRVCVDRTPD
jgi:imidazolonepropionase-like amidohydrolase